MAVEEAKRNGGFKGRRMVVDFSIIPMDDAGWSSWTRLRPSLSIPFANTMCIVEEGTSCMVPVVRQAKTESKILSALQLSKGLKKGNLLGGFFLKTKEPNLLYPKTCLKKKIEEGRIASCLRSYRKSDHQGGRWTI